MRITTYTKLAEQAAAAEKRESGSTKVVAPASPELAAEAPADFDEVKVARLKSAIESGTFRVDADQIARKLVGGA